MKTKILLKLLILEFILLGCLNQTSLDREAMDELEDRTNGTIKKEPVKIEWVSEDIFIAKYELSFFERLIRSVLETDEPLLIEIIVRPYETIYVSSGDSDRVTLSSQPVVDKYVEDRKKWVGDNYDLIEEKGEFMVTVTPRRKLAYQEVVALVGRYNLRGYSMRVYARGGAAQKIAEGLWQEEVRTLRAQGDSSFPPEPRGTERVSVYIEESEHDFILRRNQVIMGVIQEHYPEAGVIQIRAKADVKGLKVLMQESLVLLPDPWVDEMEGYYKEEGFEVSVWRPDLAVFLKIGK